MSNDPRIPAPTIGPDGEEEYLPLLCESDLNDDGSWTVEVSSGDEGQTFTDDDENVAWLSLGFVLGVALHMASPPQSAVALAQRLLTEQPEDSEAKSEDSGQDA